jgi:hypothetical protein
VTTHPGRDEQWTRGCFCDRGAGSGPLLGHTSPAGLGAACTRTETRQRSWRWRRPALRQRWSGRAGAPACPAHQSIHRRRTSSSSRVQPIWTQHGGERCCANHPRAPEAPSADKAPQPPATRRCAQNRGRGPVALPPHPLSPPSPPPSALPSQHHTPGPSAACVGPGGWPAPPKPTPPVLPPPRPRGPAE